MWPAKAGLFLCADPPENQHETAKLSSNETPSPRECSFKMRFLRPTFVAFFFICCFTTSASESATPVAQDSEIKKPLVLVHYMPWYASKPISGQWGWQWTMNKFDPEKIDENGRRQIASHHYPLIGPYDSNDPDTLQCQVLLMKLAGIDGVIVDWYGIEDFRDYGEIRRNTEQLVKFIKAAGLKFAICYEDQSVKHMVDNQIIDTADGVAHGAKVMKWLDANYFGDESYVKVDGRPILPVFGPQHFKADDWEVMINELSNQPLLLALPHLTKDANFDGSFGWPPVHGGKEAKPEDWKKYLDDLYSRQESGEPVMAAVFPKFHDIYQQVGLHDSYGSIDERDGKTFDDTLAMAIASQCKLIQIATWNDYGEGTTIEPAEPYGFRYLERLQKIEPGHNRKRADLRLPIELYKLRKKLASKTVAGDDQVVDGEKAKLDSISELLLAGKITEAEALLESFRK